MKYWSQKNGINMVTILWDFVIQTERKIKSNRPDIVLCLMTIKKNMPSTLYVSVNR